MAFLSSSLLVIIFISPFTAHCSSSSSNNLLSLSVENPEHVLISRNNNFTAGFYEIGDNAFTFAIWFTEPHQGQNLTVIWMANRDVPVNGKGSSLTLRSTGNLVLNDAGRVDVWATNTTSFKHPQLILRDDGNLVLYDDHVHVLWQSFDFPTDTLVPGQNLTKHATLVSSKSLTKPSSGFYKFFFDNDNFLCIVYEGPKDISSAYWPLYWPSSEVARSTNYTSRYAFLDPFGGFISTDHFNFRTSDYGNVFLQRKLTLDSDGNMRVYSRRTWKDQWYVSWEAFSSGCNIHGVCGENSFCTYLPYSGRRCLCLPGYRFNDETDWSLGCKPEFHLPCNRPEESRFLRIHKGNFFRYDLGTFPNFSLDQCKDLCLNFCNCKGFQYTFDGYKFTCYPKYVLVNGNLPSSFDTDFFLKLPKSYSSSFEFTHDDGELSHTKCENVKSLKLGSQGSSPLLRVLLWSALGIGGFEFVFIFFVWCLTRKSSDNKLHNYEYLTVNGFRKYSYSELKEVTRGFSEEIGRGAGGIVYKGVLKDGRVAAVKRLDEANQIESEFLAEVNIIGRLNHMNLISMWGYCAEGNYRMLVYEYMENGSLAKNLESKKSLNWRKRYEIALGTARGLAYLHEECLEWVLHCDIKPQNILLDSNYNPKVADFGLSKLHNRNDISNPSFSNIRGTRGYMAPEWVFNLPITSKVDVYSYGIVVLEMVTGKSSRVDGSEDHLHHGRPVTWVREKKRKGKESETMSSSSWIEWIIDLTVEGSFEMKMIENLVTMALECVEEDREARPTMRRVVEILQDRDFD